MKKNIKFFVLTFITLTILTYMAVHFLITDIPVLLIKVIADNNRIDKNVYEIITKNANNLPKIPAVLIENIPYIEHVIIMDNLDGTAVVRIRYKNIVAAWENNGLIFPLLDNGDHIMTTFNHNEIESLKYFVFTGVKPQNGLAIINLIKAYPKLAGKIHRIAYVEGRRFNLNLKDGRIIMLPENDALAALKKIRESGILEKNFMELDLRSPGRMLVMP